MSPLDDNEVIISIWWYAYELFYYSMRIAWKVCYTGIIVGLPFDFKINFKVRELSVLCWLFNYVLLKGMVFICKISSLYKDILKELSYSECKNIKINT